VSINPALDRVAVQRRVTQLELGEKGHPDQWRKLQADIAQLPRGESLIARTAKNFKVLRRNIAQFVRAVADHMGNQPEGDQLGPMLAGAYSLVSSDEVTLDEARAFVKKRDWEEHALAVDDNDGNQIMARFCSAPVRLVRPQGGAERSIAELLRIAAGETTDSQGIDALEAHDHLGRTSVRLSDDGTYVYIARRSGKLEKVFRNTTWEKNWHYTFGRIKGAQREALIVFAGGRPQRAVGVPREMIIPPRGKEEAA
jgi:putative DNA primase/helicase